MVAMPGQSSLLYLAIASKVEGGTGCPFQLFGSSGSSIRQLPMMVPSVIHDEKLTVLNRLILAFHRLRLKWPQQAALSALVWR
jgi:hypothetical protein